MAQGNYTKKDDEIKVLKASVDYLEKKCRKLDILNDNLYLWAYGLWIALGLSLIFNFIQFFTSWWTC